MKISVVMIVRDAESTIRAALSELSQFEDVVVYDNGSVDRTREIAQQFSNVRLIDGYFDGFGPTKNRAVSFARNEWVFVLDSDEVISPELLETLRGVHLQERIVYWVRRESFYRGSRVRYSGWGGEKIRRLYNRSITAFGNAHVHEDILVEGLEELEVGPGVIEHHSYQSLSDFVVKVDRYSSLYAESNKGKKTSSPTKAVISGLYSFFRTYVMKRGFLDGHVGLVIAFSHMATNFFKYMKLYEANQDLRLGRK